jgi:isochorismate pyruvate lyase
MTATRRKPCRDMDEVREQIDALDREIVMLLADRLHFINEAGRLKADRSAVRDDARIEDVIAKVRATAQAAGIDPDFIEPLYRQLIERSIQHEFGVFDRLHKS